MARKQSSQRVSSIAGRCLAGKKITQAEVRTLAGSVLGQDEIPAKKAKAKAKLGKKGPEAVLPLTRKRSKK